MLVRKSRVLGQCSAKLGKAMVKVEVVVHPQGLGPTEAAKAWYSPNLKPKMFLIMLDSVTWGLGGAGGTDYDTKST